MITVLGSLNVDLVSGVARFPRPGETLMGTRFHQVCGGKGANQAAALARLGNAVSLLGCVGDDPFGGWILERLHCLGVDTTGVLRRQSTPTGNALILIDASGQNQIVVNAGANGTLLAQDLTAGPLAGRIRQSEALVAQLEVPLPAVVEAFQAARAAGVPTFLNPAPFQPLPEDLLAACDWLVPNEAEASALVGFHVGDPDSAVAASRQLRKRFPKLQVLITLGSRGAWLDADDAVGAHPGFRVTAVDTVGAGDAALGAFVAGRVRGCTSNDSLRFAMAAAALSVTRPGAMDSFPTRSEVEAFVKASTGA